MINTLCNLCLWFLRDLFYPTLTEEQIRVEIVKLIYIRSAMNWHYICMLHYTESDNSSITPKATCHVLYFWLIIYLVNYKKTETNRSLSRKHRPKRSEQIGGQWSKNIPKWDWKRSLSRTKLIFADKSKISKIISNFVKKLSLDKFPPWLCKWLLVSL